MMCAYSHLSGSIKFDDSKLKVLVIENKALLRKTICSLSDNDNEGMFVFSREFKPLDFAKNVRFIPDCINFNLGDKKIITKVDAEMENITNTKYFDDLCCVRQQLMDLCEKLCNEIDYDFDFNNDVDALSLIKFMTFEPRSDCDTEAEKIISYIGLMSKYLGIKFFVVRNLYLYFTIDELTDIIKTFSLEQINVLDIESVEPVSKTQLESVYIVDCDLCEVIDERAK